VNPQVQTQRLIDMLEVGGSIPSPPTNPIGKPDLRLDHVHVTPFEWLIHRMTSKRVLTATSFGFALRKRPFSSCGRTRASRRPRDLEHGREQPINEAREL
jgi:hypothetical protein